MKRIPSYIGQCFDCTGPIGLRGDIREQSAAPDSGNADRGFYQYDGGYGACDHQLSHRGTARLRQLGQTYQHQQHDGGGSRGVFMLIRY